LASFRILGLTLGGLFPLALYYLWTKQQMREANADGNGSNGWFYNGGITPLAIGILYDFTDASNDLLCSIDVNSWHVCRDYLFNKKITRRRQGYCRLIGK
jgi:hypothetical protein